MIANAGMTTVDDNSIPGEAAGPTTYGGIGGLPMLC
jgi:hypothetical protein